MTLRPGEIYYADFGGDPDHRAVIVSREDLNRGTYVMTVPFTTQHFEKRSRESYCVVFRAGEFGCTKDCVARADQMGATHISELQLDRGLIDTLDDMKFREIIKAIGYVLDSECEPL
jgi:mRNA-degrading endonuclease toxin of MazEF toxin-antitoxin module